MLNFLASILYSMRRWRALFAWLVTAALVYPILTYVPNHAVAFYSALAIGVAGFAGGLYWESQSG
jgi:hypothetical protein